jgi:hypothetical protein
MIKTEYLVKFVLTLSHTKGAQKACTQLFQIFAEESTFESTAGYHRLQHLFSPETSV